MLETHEHGQTIAELANELKRLSSENQKRRLLEHLNMIGLLLLEDPFPGRREFYGWIIRHPNNRVGEKEVYTFLGWQKGRPDRPSFIMTTEGFTPAARDLAQRWGIELITLSKWAKYLRSGKIRIADKDDKYDIDFLT